MECDAMRLAAIRHSEIMILWATHPKSRAIMLNGERFCHDPDDRDRASTRGLNCVKKVGGEPGYIRGCSDPNAGTRR
jgi:hypothetical protein